MTIIDTSYELPDAPQPKRVLRCPFCGSEPCVGGSANLGVDGWVAWCSNSMCGMSDSFYSAMPVKEWNRRYRK